MPDNRRSHSPINRRPCTPPSLSNQRDIAQHHPTPTCTAILNIVRFNDQFNILYYKVDLWRHFNIPPRSGYKILEDYEPWRHHNNPQEKETCGRKPLISSYYTCEMKRILQEEGISARTLTWDQLSYEVSLNCSGRTIKCAMGSMDYRKCIACQKGWVSEKSARFRVDWCQMMLDWYSTPWSWYWVRFFNEVHYGYRIQSPLHIIRKPEERYCPNCIQQKEDLRETEKKKVHTWAATGYEFKSAIQFYKISLNMNGKMTLLDYKDQILNSVIKLWIQQEDDFVLEEDDNSGHRTGKSNIVRKWKAKNRLKLYFNCASSSDLSPIENCWQLTKVQLRKYLHWDEATTKDLIYKSWRDLVSQDFINRRVKSVPWRLQDIIDSRGQFAAQKWINNDVNSDTDYRDL